MTSASAESHVISIKHSRLCDVIQMTEDDVSKLISAGLTDEQLREQLTGKRYTNQQKVAHVLQFVVKKRAGFEKFCSSLRKSYPLVMDEVQGEKDRLKGKLSVSEQIDTEAAFIVHKEHGCSKRMSEEDKKHLQKILAESQKIVRDVWKKEVQRTRKEFRVQQETKELCDRYCLELVAKATKSMSTCKTKHKSIGLDRSLTSSKSTREALSEKHNAATVAVSTMITDLVHMVTSCQLAYEQVEKLKTAALTHVCPLRTDVKTVSLHLEVERELERLHDAWYVLKSRKRQKNGKSNVSAMFEGNSDLLEQVNMVGNKGLKNKKYEKLKKDLDESIKKQKKLEAEAVDMEEQLREVTEESASIKLKIEMMERNKRMSQWLKTRQDHMRAAESALDESTNNLRRPSTLLDTSHVAPKVQTRRKSTVPTATATTSEMKEDGDAQIARQTSELPAEQSRAQSSTRDHTAGRSELPALEPTVKSPDVPTWRVDSTHLTDHDTALYRVGTPRELFEINKINIPEQRRSQNDQFSFDNIEPMSRSNTMAELWSLPYRHGRERSLSKLDMKYDLPLSRKFSTVSPVNELWTTRKEMLVSKSLSSNGSTDKELEQLVDVETARTEARPSPEPTETVQDLTLSREQSMYVPAKNLSDYCISPSGLITRQIPTVPYVPAKSPSYLAAKNKKDKLPLIA